jgi:glycosyltransferase involved in cell wall biosynthesis
MQSGSLPRESIGVRFSVLIPAYNREKYVAQAVDSVLSQGFTGCEVIVVDDGSTDNTLRVLESYGSRIRVLRQSNRGPEVARNTAAEAARGEYLVLLDSDDLLLPDALTTYERVIRHFDSPSVIIGAMTNFSDQEPVSAKSEGALQVKVLKFRDYLSKTVPLGISSSRIVVKKSVFHEVGGLRDTTAKTFHLDSLNLILRVGTHGPCIVVRAPNTVAYRHHEGNTIRQLKPIARGIHVLARAERDGQYRGGKKRSMERKALIGALALSWAIAHCLRRGRVILASWLLIDTAPMVAAALAKKLRTLLFRQRTPEVLVPEVQMPTPAAGVH